MELPTSQNELACHKINREVRDVCSVVTIYHLNYSAEILCCSASQLPQRSENHEALGSLHHREGPNHSTALCLSYVCKEETRRRRSRRGLSRVIKRGDSGMVNEKKVIRKKVSEGEAMEKNVYIKVRMKGKQNEKVQS